jgi:hypothetical protein
MSVVDKRFLISRTVLVEPSSLYMAESIEDYQQEAAERYAGEIKILCKKRYPIKDCHSTAEPSRLAIQFPDRL